MQPDLFAHRTALFYTPTENLPEEFVGSGTLDVTLSVPTLDYLEYQELHGYSSPRLWVDQGQRQTWKIRWTPIWPAHITFTRFDIVRLRDDHYVMGTKALLDALKVKTTAQYCAPRCRSAVDRWAAQTHLMLSAKTATFSMKHAEK